MFIYLFYFNQTRNDSIKDIIKSRYIGLYMGTPLIKQRSVQ